MVDSRQIELISSAALVSGDSSVLPNDDASEVEAAGTGRHHRVAGPPLHPRYPDLASLATACTGCTACNLASSRQHVVISRGNPAARLMLIGEGPGQQEDETGQPFVGRAGQLLDAILASVGIDRDRDVFICNVVKCRPPGNRKPTPEEMASCRPWLSEQIRLVNPAIVLLAGATAMEGVLGLKGGITRLRGSWKQRDGRLYMPIFHPSYLLRNASKAKGSPKWLTWQDMQLVCRTLDALAQPGEAGGCGAADTAALPPRDDAV
ncbi:MAG: uracil-DNA glycosylase [Aphanocapsa feldmannii 277cV]|uniref:Type-4 uracil-DNA glycosylase n=2 Tax=Aphanocapsa feldmannii TaxID=192050 RepID=A0A524RN61_9CHRO|nr:MAG: uracil-DNA glycosylase [Aphanocapsa feldmannii 277cV]TGH18645.1 MAG: uracil-DNA glycosylase [Aphanocapsa feldmannii 277cI]